MTTILQHDMLIIGLITAAIFIPILLVVFVGGFAEGYNEAKHKYGPADHSSDLPTKYYWGGD
jgi:hypothetical protein